MRFSNGTTPPSGNIDTRFFEDLDIQGYVSAAKRGKVSGKASGIPSVSGTLISTAPYLVVK